MPDGQQSLDEQLQDRLMKNDQSVLEELLRTWGGQVLRRLVVRYQGVLTTTDIEDVISVALFRVWQSRHNKRKDGTLLGWFYRIADNAAKDVLKFGWHKAKTLEVPETTESLGWPQFANRMRDSSERNSQKLPAPNPTDVVREIVNQLPEIQRRIIWADACAPDDTVDAAALAKELNIPVGTVRVYRKRAKDKIQKELLKLGFSLKGKVCHGDVS